LVYYASKKNISYLIISLALSSSFIINCIREKKKKREERGEKRREVEWSSEGNGINH